MDSRHWSKRFREHTSSLSLSGSMEDSSSSGCSMARSKCARNDVYAALESCSLFGHVARSRLSKRRKHFHMTDRNPSMGRYGFLESLTALWRSSSEANASSSGHHLLPPFISSGTRRQVGEIVRSLFVGSHVPDLSGVGKAHRWPDSTSLHPSSKVPTEGRAVVLLADSEVTLMSRSDFIGRLGMENRHFELMLLTVTNYHSVLSPWNIK
jgi:hypothetical protein